MVEQLTHGIEWLVQHWIGGLEESGYLGIFVLMTVESSFIPFPSEIVMLPAGMLAAEGKLNLWGAIAAGTLGSLAGALINYVLAIFIGREVLYRWGKWFFVKPEGLRRAEAAWQNHGELTTFVCRLLPVVRQLISIPAGLARMRLSRFCLWTTCGAGLWVAILTVGGYAFGQQTVEIWERHKSSLTIGLVLAVVAVVAVYVWRLKAGGRRHEAVAVDPGAGE